ncbi:unnamed protein product, partial [Meganyctiphanes norvegica]
GQRTTQSVTAQAQSPPLTSIIVEPSTENSAPALINSLANMLQKLLLELKTVLNQLQQVKGTKIDVRRTQQVISETIENTLPTLTGNQSPQTPSTSQQDEMVTVINVIEAPIGPVSAAFSTAIPTRLQSTSVDPATWQNLMGPEQE